MTANTINDILQLKLSGNDVRPKKLKSKEVAELLIGLEDAIVSLILRQNPKAELPDDLFISLVEIQESSAALKFVPNKRVLIAAFTTIATAIHSNNYDGLPIRTIESLKPIDRFVKRRNCNADFIINEQILAQISPSTIIAVPASAKIFGETVVYADVQRVGGAEPRVVLKIGDKAISVKIDTDTAKKLASKLYTTVGLAGRATWERDTYEILEFKIDDVLDFEKTDIQNAFNGIKGLIGTYWNDTDDIDSFLD